MIQATSCLKSVTPIDGLTATTNSKRASCETGTKSFAGSKLGSVLDHRQQVHGRACRHQDGGAIGACAFHRPDADQPVAAGAVLDDEIAVEQRRKILRQSAGTACRRCRRPRTERRSGSAGRIAPVPRRLARQPTKARPPATNFRRFMSIPSRPFWRITTDRWAVRNSHLSKASPLAKGRRLLQNSGSFRRIPPLAMKRPALKNFRRIVVKVGSSLLIDSAKGEVRASWLAALVGRYRQAAWRGPRSPDRLVRLDRARPQPPETAARHAQARGEPGRRGGGADRAGADLVGGAGAARHRLRADPGDAAGHRGTAALSQRALDHRKAAGMARGARHQRERHGRHQRNPLRRQ